MIQTITKSDFINAFKSWDTYKDNFTYEGLEALYNYLEEIDENYNLDVVAICCDFSEYSDIEDFWKNEGFSKEDYPDKESIKDACTFIEVGDEGFIIAGL